MGHRGFGRVCDGGAGPVGRGQGSGQEVIEIGGQTFGPAWDGTVFMVAWLTGSKNAVKGVGFFLGAAMLGLIGFDASLWTMAAVLSAILIAVAALFAHGPARKEQGGEAFGNLVGLAPDQAAVIGADVPVWRVRCLVCGGHSDLFSIGSV